MDRICHSSTKNLEMTHLQRVFEANGFPRPTVKKILSHSGQESKPPRSTDEGQKILYLPYVQSLSERTEQVCRPLNIRTVFNSSFTLQQSLVQVKNCTLADRKKEVVYKITCGDCEAVYIGETGRTLQKRVTKHKYAVQGYDVKNGIAVHAWSKEHRVDWDSARVVALAPYTWERCVTEALHICQQASTMNLDCGLHISPIRNPILNHPFTPIPESTNPTTSPDYP